jgi:hypothetical protein
MGYLHEAEWSHQNHKPSFVDHVKLTSMNIGVPAICVSMMTCMNDQMMKPALEWAASVPDVIIAVGKISRFMNDIGAFEVYMIFLDNVWHVTHFIHINMRFKKLIFNLEKQFK